MNVDPTERHCPESDGGLDRHHLVPRGNVLTCTYCERTEAQLREHGGIVARTQEELAALLIARFGPDPQKWAFKCPACGDIAVAKDFTDAGYAGYGSDRLGKDCIGRYLGALSRSKEATRGCDWTANGLFQGPELVIDPTGHKWPAFPPAPAPVGG